MSDLINRQAAIDAIEKNAYRHTYLDQIIDIIKALPSADSERKKSKWIPVTNGRGGFECENCHHYAPSYQDGVEWLSDYCPNCGAKME